MTRAKNDNTRRAADALLILRNKILALFFFFSYDCYSTRAVLNISFVRKQSHSMLFKYHIKSLGENKRDIYMIPRQS